jgi:hypothetical protein
MKVKISALIIIWFYCIMEMLKGINKSFHSLKGYQTNVERPVLVRTIFHTRKIILKTVKAAFF